MSNLRYAPAYQVRIDGKLIAAAMQASVTQVSFETSFDAADRVELTLANEGLRWLDEPALALGRQLQLALGYSPDPLTIVFNGTIVGLSPNFPSGSAPTLTVVAQDRRQDLQQQSHVRCFAIPWPSLANIPLPDPAVLALVSLEHALIPITDPVSAALAVLVGMAEIAVVLGDPDATQQVIRKQLGESDFDFLSKIAHENGWEMVIDHSGSLGGWKLQFLSTVTQLSPDLTLRYGQSLVDFSPKITNVGQIAAIAAKVWVPQIVTEFSVKLAWDWDRSILELEVVPSIGFVEDAADLATSALSKSANPTGTLYLVDEPLNPFSAPRVIVSKLLDRLNGRFTGSGTAVGDPGIRAGTVLQLEGLGEQFGGLYRVTSASHSIDGGGYRTRFQVRKDVWFQLIPLVQQGATRLVNAARQLV